MLSFETCFLQHGGPEKAITGNIFDKGQAHSAPLMFPPLMFPPIMDDHKNAKFDKK